MRPLYLILLLLWFVASYFLCKDCFCNTVSAATSTGAAAVGAAAATDSDEGCMTELKFEYGDAFMKATSENFRFDISDAVHNDPSDVLNGVVGDVVSFLTENDNLFVQLTGYYLDGEENSTEFDNLGIARAKGVREMLKDAGVPGNQITTMGEMAESICVNDGVLQKGITAKISEIPDSE